MSYLIPKAEYKITGVKMVQTPVKMNFFVVCLVAALSMPSLTGVALGSGQIKDLGQRDQKEFGTNFVSLTTEKPYLLSVRLGWSEQYPDRLLIMVGLTGLESFPKLAADKAPLTFTLPGDGESLGWRNSATQGDIEKKNRRRIDVFEMRWADFERAFVEGARISYQLRDDVIKYTLWSESTLLQVAEALRERVNEERTNDTPPKLSGGRLEECLTVAAEAFADAYIKRHEEGWDVNRYLQYAMEKDYHGMGPQRAREFGEIYWDTAGRLPPGFSRARAAEAWRKNVCR